MKKTLWHDHQESLEYLMRFRFFLHKLQIIHFTESFFNASDYIENHIYGKAIDKADSNAKRNIKSP